MFITQLALRRNYINLIESWCNESWRCVNWCFFHTPFDETHTHTLSADKKTQQTINQLLKCWKIPKNQLTARWFSLNRWLFIIVYVSQKINEVFPKKGDNYILKLKKWLTCCCMAPRNNRERNISTICFCFLNKKKTILPRRRVGQGDWQDWKNSQARSLLFFNLGWNFMVEQICVSYTFSETKSPTKKGSKNLGFHLPNVWRLDV